MFDSAKRDWIAAAAVVLTVGSLSCAAHGAQAQDLPVYYNPNDAAALAPTMFVRIVPPPADPTDNRTVYAYGPITDSYALNIASQNSSTWKGREWADVWANRARVARGGIYFPSNPTYPAIFDSKGNAYGTEFTTVAKANAVTKAQILYILGAGTATWQAPLLAAGMSAADAIAWVTVNNDPDAYFIYNSQDGQSKVTLDKMVIPTTVSVSAYGLGIDYEVHDGRTVSEAHDFLDDLGKTIRSYGLKAYLFTNPWESNITPLNGFSFTRMDDLKANFDYLSLFVWGSQSECDINSAGYQQAIAFLKGVSGKLKYGQLLLTIDLLNCTRADAQAIYKQNGIDHFAGYALFDHGTTAPSSLSGTNLIVDALLHG